MSFDLSLPRNSGLIAEAATAEYLLKKNETTAAFGLELAREQALRLARNNLETLRSEQRIEFGESAVAKLIDAFCDSPYLSPRNYEQTLAELTEIFYYYKNETQDRLGDDALIRRMKCAFDGPCAGSTELLAGRDLDRLARGLRDPDGENG